MADIPEGAVPVSDFKPDAMPEGSIPIHDFQANNSPPPGAIPVSQFVSDEDQYGGTAGTIKAGLQGGLKGLIGPLAPVAEKLAGVKYSTQRGLEAAHPIASGIGETGALIGGALTGTGEAALLGKLGEAGVGLTGLGEGASTAAKIAAEGVNQATQMALFQGGDNVTRMIRQDPDAAAETALSHVGLAAAIGGVTGVGLGSISPIWKATVGSKLAPVLEDMKSRFNFRLNTPDIPTAVTQEMHDLVGNTDNIMKTLYSEEGGGVKAEQIAKAMPELTPKNTQKVDEQIQNVSNRVDSILKSMNDDVKVKSKVPYIQQDLNQFQSVITNPEATYADKFNALNDFKRVMQGYSRYGASVDDTAFGAITKKLAAEIRPALEDSKVWGKAADIQRDVNKAISEHIPAQKDIMSRFTTKVGGESVVDPSKINTYVNQLGKPSAEIKQEMVKNALKSSDKLVQTIGDIFTAQGLDSPVKPTSTSVLRDTLGEKTTGAKIVDSLIDKQLSGILGKTIGGGVGSIIGHGVGHEGIGFLAGEHILGPFFSSIMPGLSKNFLDNPSSVNGLKSALDYGAAVAKGDKALSKSIGGVFRPSVAVLSSRQMPSEASRAVLDKLVAKNDKDPNTMGQSSNGHLGHYASDHQTSLSTANARSIQYLQGLKPKPFQSSPLDVPIEPTKAEEARYNRALDIAQSPNIVLQRVKDGTLQTTDLQDLNAMYPALYKEMSTRLTDAMSAKHATDEIIPYRTKIGASLFLGQPLDTSMKPMSIIAAQPVPKPQPQQNASMKNRKGTNSLGKSNNTYKTTTQAAESDRGTRD